MHPLKLAEAAIEIDSPHSAKIGRPIGQKYTGVETTYDGHLSDEPTTSLRLRGVVGCSWHLTGHTGNQLGRPVFSSGQQQADMMMM